MHGTYLIHPLARALNVDEVAPIAACRHFVSRGFIDHQEEEVVPELEDIALNQLVEVGCQVCFVLRASTCSGVFSADSACGYGFSYQLPNIMRLSKTNQDVADISHSGMP